MKLSRHFYARVYTTGIKPIPVIALALISALCRSGILQQKYDLWNAAQELETLEAILKDED